MTITNPWQPRENYDEPRRLIGWTPGGALLINSEIQEGFVGGSLVPHYREFTYTDGFSPAVFEDFIGKMRGRPIYDRLPSYSNRYNKDGEVPYRIYVENLTDMLTRTDLESGVTAIFLDRSQAYLLQATQPLPDEFQFYDTLGSIATPEEGITYLSEDFSEAFIYDGAQFLPTDFPSVSRLTVNWITTAIPDPEIADWLTFPWDADLVDSKSLASNFFEDYLDPATCRDDVLDWLAQFFGWTGEIWNTGWETFTKRTLLLNSLGWWNEDYTQETGAGTVLTIKGEALEGFPFNNGFWKQSVVPTEIGLPWFSYRQKAIYNGTSELVEISNDLQTATDKDSWRGIHSMKGTAMSAHFLFDISILRGASPDSFDLVGSGYFVKPDLSFLSVGVSATTEDLPLRLWHIPQIQYGDSFDVSVANFSNQGISGQSRAGDEESARSFYIRLPFAYERGGRPWNDALHVANFFLPVLMNVIVSYAYPVAGYVAVNDPFFDFQF